MDSPNIVIKNTDKGGGGGVVILNTSDYLAEALRILSDINYYQPLTEDLTRHTIKHIYN